MRQASTEPARIMSTLDQRDNDGRPRASELALSAPIIDPVASSTLAGPLLEGEDGAPAQPLSAVLELERRERIYRRSLGAADAVACLLATLICILAAGRRPTWAVVCVGAFAVLIAKVEGLYDRDDQVIQKFSIAEWRTVLQTATITSIGIYLAWRGITDAPSGGGMRLFLLLLLTGFGLAVILRWLARGVARRISPEERCVIVGDPRAVAGLAQRLDAAVGVELVCMLDEDTLTGAVAQLRAVVDEFGLHRLLIAPSGESQDRALALIQAAKYLGIRVSLVPSVMTAVGGFATLEELDGITLLGVPRFGLSRSSSLLKRAFDLLVGLLALVGFAPLMLIIAAWIKLDTRGPVLFRQTRVGRAGQPFEILKFRSMVNDAESLKAGLRGLNEAGDGLFKIADDPRITRVGRHLRAAHLDELPQLFNVLRGEMSLVGPRPLVTDEDAGVMGHDRQRIRLTPGMTGPWQVKGPMRTALSEMAMLDYRYASNWSIWTDLDILLQTSVRMLRRSGH
jgi:exopolysaccharide biosynthesis polyprenyl glycosylphosphotransferase